MKEYHMSPYLAEFTDEKDTKGFVDVARVVVSEVITDALEDDGTLVILLSNYFTKGGAIEDTLDIELLLHKDLVFIGFKGETKSMKTQMKQLNRKGVGYISGIVQ